VVGANKDYAEFRQMLEAVDRLLRGSHLEAMAVDFAKEEAGEVSFVQLRNRMEFALKALRFEVLRLLLGNMSFRKLSRSIAASDLLADFCGVRTREGIHGVLKKRTGAGGEVFHRRAGTLDGTGVCGNVRRAGPRERVGAERGAGH
jgi:hypothetical protein